MTRYHVDAIDPASLAEFIRDTVATTLVPGANVTISVDDTGDTITIASSATGEGGGSGVGGGLRGDWVAGSYSPNDMVFHGGYLFAARATTTDAPLAGAARATTDVGGSAWSRNSIASSTASEVVLINGATSDTATLISTEIFGSGFPSGVLTVSVRAEGTADWLDFGVLNSSVAATTLPGSGLNDVRGFWGCRLDIFNGNVTRYADGFSDGATAHSPKTIGYETWTLEYAFSGASNVIMTLKRAGGATTVATWTVTRPTTWTGWRFAFGARSGGSSGTFSVQNRPSITDPNAVSPDWRRICKLVDAA